ncbi:MAG: aminodeoxychorismate lyase [Gammaproteobacteria bacterium]|nr:aminodeoxychorismate lyase [Gammaproteobacteria bacterium]
MATTPTRCLVNGRPGDTLSVRDRGLAYGDGLFETIRVSRGCATLLHLHLSRLARGAAVLRLALDLSQIQAELEVAAAELGSGLLKLVVTRGEAGRGYAMPEPACPTRILHSSPLPGYPVANAQQGISLYSCATRLGNQPLLAGIKHLNRLEQVLARSEWQGSEHAEGLVCDLQGDPVECTMSNLFLRLDGQWLTPALDQCGVRGVMRDYLMEQFAATGELVIERRVSSNELLASDEVFCCNSVFGVWPVIRLGDRQWPVGPHTRHAVTLAEQVLI